MRPGLSVRLRITTTVAVLVALALAGAGFSFYVIEDRRIDTVHVQAVEQELDEFRRLATTAGPYQLPGAEDPLTGVAPVGVADLLYGFVQRNVPTEEEKLVGWWEDGARIDQAERSSPEDVAGTPAFAAAVRPLVADGGSVRTTIDGQSLLLTVQPASVEEGGTTSQGALVVVTYTDVAHQQLTDTVRTYTLVAMAALLLVVAVASWQSGRLLRPLRVLRRSAEEISGTDLSRRVPETGNDDITDLTRTVNGMLARLESAFTGQRQFLDDAGHELRTPLTILRGHLELLETDSPEARETRDLLLDEVDRMARLVGDLLLLAKSDRPDFLTTAPVDVADLAATVLSKARGLGPRDWTLDVPAGAVAPPVLEADEQRLTQALLQLCDNAVKHTAPGDVVAVGWDVVRDGARDGAVRLWVRDSGPGVPEADRERIFERFGRSHVPDDDEGFGLGLSIVAAIAAAHGGSVAVTPASPTGALFVLTVPTREEPPWPAS
ncbi:HAMP domain-containing sensor histidine kinase [Nocardioides zeae]|uniref:histidine kinase n=1 Tax=Nocardioides zeae TaxID=1457234 RepID=A0AAJ1TWY4_9ACTN|nr:HAMP domain-containing sensor histidine kinase [Nocardioides zeae]MDQ1103505.1 two-component system OmpR family sensor kinase [Nocardioides zeae]